MVASLLQWQSWLISTEIYMVHSSFCIADWHITNCNDAVITTSILNATHIVIPQYFKFYFLLPVHTHDVRTTKKNETQRERKVDFKCHMLKAMWSMAYFVFKLDGKALCLTCSKIVVFWKNTVYLYTLELPNKILITIFSMHRMQWPEK